MPKNKIIPFLFLFLFAVYTPLLARREINREKSCFSNQRLLLSAIEMYNMDNNEMLHELDDNAQDLLIRGKYLKSDRVIICPDSAGKGKYYSQGDLCEDGVIYCDYHGSMDRDEKGNKIVPESREYQIRERRIKFQQRIYDFFPVIFIIAVIAFIGVIIPGNKKKKY